MAFSLKHFFHSLKGDGTDPTKVQPSNWNEEHVLTMATSTMIGRVTAGTGPAEELPLSAFMSGLLASTDINALIVGLGGAVFFTGDIKQSMSTTVPPGWVFFGGTIGNAASGGTTRANEDVKALWVVLYAAYADGILPVSGGRSGNAVNDFNAGKTMNLNIANARVFANQYGLFGYGQTFGEAAHTLTQSELPAVGLGVSVSGTASVAVTSTRADVVVAPTGFFGAPAGDPLVAFNSGAGVTTITSTGSGSVSASGGTAAMGSGAAHNNYQPTMGVVTLLKL